MSCNRVNVVSVTLSALLRDVRSYWNWEMWILFFFFFVFLITLDCEYLCRLGIELFHGALLLVLAVGSHVNICLILLFHS